MTNSIHIAEAAAGAVAELARQGGQNLSAYHPHGAAQLGQLAVQGAAVIAPGAVAAASVGTAAVISTATAAAVALAPIVVTGAVLFGTFKLVEWLEEQW